MNVRTDSHMRNSWGGETKDGIFAIFLPNSTAGNRRIFIIKRLVYL